jgi:hypothetical protein
MMREISGDKGGKGVALIFLSSSTSIAQSHTNGVDPHLARSERPLAPQYTSFIDQRMGMLSGGSNGPDGEGKG